MHPLPRTGFWCSAGKAFACVIGTYSTGALRDSADSCKPCPLDATTRTPNSSSRNECVCTQGFFMNAMLECERCPLPGSSCTELGATLKCLPLDAGYWRISENSTDIRACPDSKKADDSACTGVCDEPCKPGLTGVYCTSCVGESGVYFSKDDASCEPCDEELAQKWLIAIVSLCVMSFAALLGCLLTARLRRPAKRSICASFCLVSCPLS